MHNYNNYTTYIIYYSCGKHQSTDDIHLTTGVYTETGIY